MMKLHKYHVYGLILFLLVFSALCVGQKTCENVTCGRVCRGEDLWEQKCINGECVDSRIIERESEECGYIDPCKGVICDDGCFGTDLWRMKCLEGECVPDYILEKNSEQCGIPETPESPDTDHDGIPDSDDDCHNPGCTIVNEYGCPEDSDGDGLADCYDDCPEEAGEKANKGCPKEEMPGLIGWEGSIPVIDWRYADQYYGQYVIIEGTIVDTYNSGQACFLNFHTEWEKYFTAVIFAEDFNKFPANPEVYYLGKKVRIRGVVQEYQGKPEIIVKDPSQIVIID